MKEHVTHHDDCGCKTAKFEAEIEELKRKLEIEKKERAEADAKWRSLSTELWEGVRAHKLEVPARGEEGERLIHAYCGGLVREQVKREMVQENIAELRESIGHMKEACDIFEKNSEELCEVEEVLREFGLQPTKEPGENIATVVRMLIEALDKISSCQSHVPGDVVDIAKKIFRRV